MIHAKIKLHSVLGLVGLRIALSGVDSGTVIAGSFNAPCISCLAKCSSWCRLIHQVLKVLRHAMAQRDRLHMPCPWACRPDGSIDAAAADGVVESGLIAWREESLC